MKTTEIKIKNFTGSCYGVFENGNFISSNDGWQKNDRPSYYNS